MNFAYLAKKYFSDCIIIVHDRTYDGLEWRGPGDKPSLEIFEAFQKEEDRLERAAGRAVMSQESTMQEKQRQARAQAELDMVPFQKKLGEFFEQERLRCLKLYQDALETKSLIASKEHVITAWSEITEAQSALNKQAQTYLEETQHFTAWDQDKVPKDVLEKRAEAHRILMETKVVYAEWAALRQAEMPSREEIAEAIRAGGEHLKNIKKRCKEVALKYHKPRKV